MTISKPMCRMRGACIFVSQTPNRPVVSGAFTEHGVGRMVEMMQLFRRDRADLIQRPMSIFTITATGNFRYSEDSCQNLLDCVEAGVPVEIVPVTLMGLTAPVTWSVRPSFMPWTRSPASSWRRWSGQGRPYCMAVHRQSFTCAKRHRPWLGCRHSIWMCSMPKSVSDWACRRRPTWR